MDVIEALSDNVMRLVADARLLKANQRYSSAFVLAAIALEELGKLVLLMWKRDDIEPKTRRRTAHLRKQSAIAAVILAESVYDDIIAIARSGVDMTQAIETLSQKIVESDAGSQMVEAELAMVEKAKHAGLYQDFDEDDRPTTRVFTAEEVEDMLNRCARGARAIQNKLARIIGRSLFDASAGKWKEADLRANN